jgi:hypothetical protein
MFFFKTRPKKIAEKERTPTSPGDRHLIDTEAGFAGLGPRFSALSAVCSWRAVPCIVTCTHDRLLSERFSVERNIKLRERLVGKCQEFSPHRSCAPPAAVKFHFFLGILLIDPDKA